MNWFNFNTSEMDDVAEFPVSAEEWEPYIPRHRRTEFWLRCQRALTTPTEVATNIIQDEGQNKSPWKRLYDEMVGEMHG